MRGHGWQLEGREGVGVCFLVELCREGGIKDGICGEGGLCVDVF